MANTATKRPPKDYAAVSGSLLALGLMHVVLLICADTTPRPASTNGNISTITPARLSELNDLCPGVDYIMEQNDTNSRPTILQVNVPDCKKDLPDYTLHQGVIYGVCSNLTTFCHLHVQVAQDMVVQAHFHRVEYWCDSTYWSMFIYQKWSTSYFLFAKADSVTYIYSDEDSHYIFKIVCGQHSIEQHYIRSLSNHMYLKYYNKPGVKIQFEAAKIHPFRVVFSSSQIGYLTFPLVKVLDKTCVDFWEELKIPPHYSIMVSFELMLLHLYTCEDFIELLYKDHRKSQESVIRICSSVNKTTDVLRTNRLQVHLHLLAFSFPRHEGIKMLFSFHPLEQAPRTLACGFFNCSVDYYSSFQFHLDCNQETECEDGRDETEHCPFSSPGCKGLVASRNKCFQRFVLESSVSLKIAIYQCRKLGGNSASIKTRKELEIVASMFKRKIEWRADACYSSGWYFVPFMYSKCRKWPDNTLLYNIKHMRLDFPYCPRRSPELSCLGTLTVLRAYLPSFRPNDYNTVGRMPMGSLLCQIKPQIQENLPQTVQLSGHKHSALFTLTQQVLFACEGDHVTHTFSSCDGDSHCSKATYPLHCSFVNLNNNSSILSAQSAKYSVAMFSCDDGIITLPYTLVCDFTDNCPDKSDESFCEHPPCKGFMCTNGKCILNSQRCNELLDCVDESDERECVPELTDEDTKIMERLGVDEDEYTPSEKCNPVNEADEKQRLFINLDGTGYYTQQVMTDDKSCPATHYQCTTDWLYCLPVYTRCNGFSDCTHGEDEQDCETVTCPGFYRCQTSSVCVHGDHLCDGWGQCPQHDDECFCDITCPDICLCQGFSFLCPRSFSAERYPQLHYLDATHSGMTLSDLNNNAYLIRLSLSYCSLFSLQDSKLYNLQYLDLSNNQLTTISMKVLSELLNLQIILLSNNPLTSLKSMSFKYFNYVLRKVDLSGTCLKIFDRNMMAYSSQLQHLNLSFSALQVLGSKMFQNMPQLTHLDIRGNPVTNFPLDLLSSLNHLTRLFSSNYRLCCHTVLPKQSSQLKCSAPEAVFSSCDNLLPSAVHRLMFWSVSVIVILGNLSCVIAQCTIKKDIFEASFITCIVHLHCAYICMGINTSIVAIADRLFYGDYTSSENMWTTGVICTMAGFLSIVSSEVSVLIICFITVGHIIVYYLPLITCRLNTRSMAAVWVVSWILGFFIASIPVLPESSNWGIYGQTGVCHLALSNHFDSNKGFRWFTVIVAFNFILCSVAMAGLTIIYRKIPKYKIIMDCNKKSICASVELLVKMNIINVLCWSSFCVVSVMDLASVFVSDQLSINMVMLLIPLNSALSPFLYFWTLKTWQRTKAQEEKLLEVMKSRLRQKTTRSQRPK